MKIIKIVALDNGAHDNQTIDGATPRTFHVPEGWAVIPEDMVCENFPFGEITVDGSVPPLVTSWTPGEIPEPEPMPEPESEPTVWDELAAAYMEGVNSAYEQ